MTAQPKRQVLEGVRVLDVGPLAAGPIASSILADFGADVIHIESPETADWTATVTAAGRGARSARGDALHHRNKRNITLHMARPEARDLFHKLVAVSDMVTENFRPFRMEEWGHDWETLHHINPRLIYCRLSGFGQTGPYQSRRAYGMIGEGFSGWGYLNGPESGLPVHSNFAWGDTMDAIYATGSIMMALYWRDAQGGEGQLIDQGLYEPLYRMLEQHIIIYDQTGVSIRRHGTRHEATPYADVCRTKDGRYFSFSALTHEAIRNLLQALGLSDDSRFGELRSCLHHREEFQQAVTKWFEERTLAEAVEAFEKHGAVGAPVMSGEDLCHDPHIESRDMLLSVSDPEGGRPIKMQGIVPKLSESPGEVRRASEPMGARNEEVFGELLGPDTNELAELREARVI